MDREDIRNEIRRLIRDTDSVNPRWSDTVLNSRIDLAHERIASVTKCIETRIDDNIAADTAEYTLSSNWIDIISVMIKNSNNEWMPLEKTTEKELDLLKEGWRNDDDVTPCKWYIRQNYLGLYPTPNTAKTDGLRVDLHLRPTSMSADSMIPFNELYELYPYHEVIPFEVASKCLYDSSQFNEAIAFEQKVERLVNQMNQQLSKEMEGTRIPNVYEAEREFERHTY